MNQRLKRWESPRKEGRNDKGKGGSARQRQKKKQFQMLRKKLNSQNKRDAASGISFVLGNDSGANRHYHLVISSNRNLLGKVRVANLMKISLAKNSILKLVMLKLKYITRRICQKESAML